MAVKVEPGLTVDCKFVLKVMVSVAAGLMAKVRLILSKLLSAPLTVKSEDVIVVVRSVLSTTLPVFETFNEVMFSTPSGN